MEGLLRARGSGSGEARGWGKWSRRVSGRSGADAAAELAVCPAAENLHTGHRRPEIVFWKMTVLLVLVSPLVPFSFSLVLIPCLFVPSLYQSVCLSRAYSFSL